MLARAKSQIDRCLSADDLKENFAMKALVLAHPRANEVPRWTKAKEYAEKYALEAKVDGDEVKFLCQARYGGLFELCSSKLCEGGIIDCAQAISSYACEADNNKDGQLIVINGRFFFLDEDFLYMRVLSAYELPAGSELVGELKLSKQSVYLCFRA